MSWHPDAGGSSAATPASEPEPAAGAPEPSDEGPSPNRRALAIAGIAVLLIVAVVALVGGTAGRPGDPTFPPVGVTPGPAGSVAAATRGEVVRALAVQGLQAEDAARSYRPAEAPEFATAPRLVVRAILPEDPDHGRIVIYEFASPPAATSAAASQAVYLASGVGRVQFPPDARFVLRVVGATAVFFTWSPAGSRDARTAQIGTALETLGLGVAIPG